MNLATNHSAAPGRANQIGLLSISFFAASGLGLLFIVAVARWLEPAQNAQFQAVWGLIFAFASVIASVEQEVTRRSTVANMQGQKTPIGAVQAVALAAVFCVALAAVVLASPPGRVMVQGSWQIAFLVLFSVTNVAILVLGRGVLLGSNSLRSYSGILVGEAMIRVALIAFLLVLGVDAILEWAVFATAAGSLVWIGALVRLMRSIEWSSDRDPWRSVGGTVAALGIANGLSALALTGFPAVAAVALGDTTDLAVLFAVVTLARAPLALLAPVQALVVPTVVRWSQQGDRDQLAQALRLIAASSTAAAIAGAAVSYAIGPWAIEVVIGAQYRPEPTMAALVAAATFVMAAALLQAAALVALEGHWDLVRCWAAAISSAAVLMLAAPWSAEQRGLAGFTVASAVAFAGTAFTLRGSVASATDGHDPRRFSRPDPPSSASDPG